MVWVGFTKSLIIIGAYFSNKCDCWSTLWIDRMLCSAAADTMAKTKNVDHVGPLEKFMPTPSLSLERVSSVVYSPDLSPLDFGFAEYLKLKIHWRNFSSFETLWPPWRKFHLTFDLHSSSVDYFSLWHDLSADDEHKIYSIYHIFIMKRAFYNLSSLSCLNWSLVYFDTSFPNC